MSEDPLFKILKYLARNPFLEIGTLIEKLKYEYLSENSLVSKKSYIKQNIKNVKTPKKEFRKINA